MNPRWLILDAQNLAWRCHHAMWTLTHNKKATGVLFGFLRDLTVLDHKFRPDNFVVCFDDGPSLRKKVCPQYKANRKVLLEEDVKARKNVNQQIDLLKYEILHKIGIQNVVFQEGYEADDCIAQVVNQLGRDNEFVVVSNDRDLYQLLSETVSIWNYKKVVTDISFMNEHNIPPREWIRVKAIAGCRGDNIEGIRGVGETTATKFLCGTLPTTSIWSKRITMSGGDIEERNLPLVKIPYPGLLPIPLKPTQFDSQAWDEVAEEYRLKTLKGMCPGSRIVETLKSARG